MVHAFSLILCTDTCGRIMISCKVPSRPIDLKASSHSVSRQYSARTPDTRSNRKIKDLSRKAHAAGCTGESLHTQKNPELVFHSSWHLHWHYSAQLWSPCLLHIILSLFLPMFVEIYGHIPVAGLWFLLSFVFVGFAQRESCLHTCLMLMSF